MSYEVSLPDDISAQEERAHALARVEASWVDIQYIPKEWKNDREIALTAARQNGLALLYLSSEIKNDREIVLAAVGTYHRGLSYASEALRDDRDVVLAAVRRYGRALSYASARLKDDHAVVLAAVRQEGKALKDAAEALKDDEEIVLAAVAQDGAAYASASLRLQKDPRIALAAVQQDPAVFRRLPKELQEAREIALAAVRKNGHALRHLPEALRGDKEIVLAAVTQNWRAFEHAAPALRDDDALQEIVGQEQRRQSSARTKVLNFLWLNLDLPPKPDPEDGSIRLPLPEEYIRNVRKAAKRHPDADIDLWIDSRRLTRKQRDYLEAVVENGLRNVRVRDLCTIPAYLDEPLYSRTETNRKWREHGYHGVIWLQVDTAKILISLQGEYDQHFFADLDHAHLDIASDEVQGMIRDHGLMIGSGSGDSHFVENQLWGFDRSRLGFFEDYYAEGLKDAYLGEVAFNALSDKVERVLNDFEKLPTDAFCLPIDGVGLTHAEQPGHEWSNYKGRATVSSDKLRSVFNKRNKKAKAHAARPSWSAAPA